jgi:predicted  nucleic acid-binding Zn-ribbon protein
MHQQLIDTYTSLMADLMTLPEEVAAAQSDLTKSKFSLDQCVKEMDRLEAETSLTVEGKNAEERKARLALALTGSVIYSKLAAEATGWRKDIAKLTNDVDNLTRQFTAVGYAAKLHASLLAYLAGPGAQQPVGDVSFGMGGKTHLSNGAVTAADAADIGL